MIFKLLRTSASAKRKLNKGPNLAIIFLFIGVFILLAIVIQKLFSKEKKGRYKTSDLLDNGGQESSLVNREDIISSIKDKEKGDEVYNTESTTIKMLTEYFNRLSEKTEGLYSVLNNGLVSVTQISDNIVGERYPFVLLVQKNSVIEAIFEGSKAFADYIKIMRDEMIRDYVSNYMIIDAENILAVLANYNIRPLVLSPEFKFPFAKRAYRYWSVVVEGNNYGDFTFNIQGKKYMLFYQYNGRILAYRNKR